MFSDDEIELRRKAYLLWGHEHPQSMGGTIVPDEQTLLNYRQRVINGEVTSGSGFTWQNNSPNGMTFPQEMKPNADDRLTALEAEVKALREEIKRLRVEAFDEMLRLHLRLGALGRKVTGD